MQIGRTNDRVSWYDLVIKKFVGKCVEFVVPDTSDLAEAQAEAIRCKLDTLQAHTELLCKTSEANSTNEACDRG